MRGRAKSNEPLAPHTTLRIGGPADLFVRVDRIADFVQTVQLARQLAIPIFILGNGSNILVRDGGVRGLVIENHCDQSSLAPNGPSRAIMRAESGASLPGLANRFAREGWSGLEWGIGVPGTIGGAVASNAGAHNGCIADILQRVSILDSQGSTRELPKNDLAFAYRASRFKGKRDEIILSAEFELRRDEPAVCIARMNEYTQHRRRTQPTDPSVGSMFKNPPDDFAGRLIEQAGCKGMRAGKAEVSEAHANFFVNHGGARARDVLELVDTVRERVQAKFGIVLELEIEVVGDE
ncbi:MAG: UDP-N-acetylmuramate dehydrogenase [Chloroflexi bacterium]|nr:UDP-N-acetylmuramate dehydrogenase [Chloroflexota bacterium]